MKNKILYFSFILNLYLFLIFCGCNLISSKKLVIFHAGSFSNPLRELVKEFKKENPNIEVFLESCGSIECVMKITELHKKCDVLFVSDNAIINEFLIPQHAQWSIGFCENEMVIAYNTNSKMHNVINISNWYDILLNEDVALARSNPDLDPCGYRTIHLFHLAEKFYKLPQLAKKLITKNRTLIRPKETDLLALLEIGAVDYIFIYRSVAKQHNLNFLELPDSINLKSHDLQEFYRTSEIEVRNKYNDKKTLIKGSSIVYGLTIPENSKNKELAVKFVEFILARGKPIIKNNHQNIIDPLVIVNFDKIPEKLKKYAKKI